MKTIKPIYIEEERFDKLITDAHPLLIDHKEIIHQCYHCGERIRYPLIVRECDRKFMLTLIQIANDYLTEKGVTELMLTEIINKCKLHKRLNQLRKEI